MILASSGIIASSISGVDADWLAFYNRVIAAGGSLTTTEQNATKTLVADLKANGLWTPMKAIYPMVGASAAACAQNLKSSSFTGTFTSGWTFESSGVTPNGTSAYMNTNLNQSSNLGASNNHISVYSRTDANGTTTPLNIQVDCGITDNSTYSFSQILSRLNNAFNYENGSQTTSISNTNSLGMYVGSSTSNTSGKAYKNGSLLATSTTTQAKTLYNKNIYIAATNNTITSLPIHYSSRQYAFASIGDGLTDTQASNFYTAVQTFQTTLNRQVV